MNYHNKYLKYKLKYLELKIGGGVKSAEDKFYSTLSKTPNDILKILNSDKLLNLEIKCISSELPPISFFRGKTINDLKCIPILNAIFNLIKSKVDKNYIDLFVKIYLKNNLGIPNSLENIGRFNENMDNFTILRQNNKTTKDHNTFVSLTELEDFIESNNDLLEEIKIKNEKKIKRSEEFIKIKELGEDDVIKVLETNNITIYVPTTKEGSIYYGSNTRWCTASKEGNAFDYYNEEGKLYIIQSNSDPKEKYQLQFETEEYRNAKDEEVELRTIIDNLFDGKLTDWLIMMYKINSNNEIIYNYNLDITYLCLGNKFNHPIGNLLKNLKNLKIVEFGKKFNQLLGNSLLNLLKLKFLKFGQEFNNCVDNKLPKNLTHLTFGYYFDNSVDKLAENLTHLTFGVEFNKSVDKLPKNLTHLTFGVHFNNSVDKLPKNLTHLTFGENFNKSVDKLPENLTHLTFGESFNNNVDELPVNLTHLTFCSGFRKTVDKLPENLTHLTFGKYFNNNVDKLPNSITHLTFGKYFNNNVDELPENLTHLTFDLYSHFNNSVDSLPENLTHLTFGQFFNNSVNKLPKNLTNLTFGFLFNNPIYNLLENLSHLTFGWNFNNSVDDLPENLSHLTFGASFNKSVDYLPENLTHLTFGNDFDNLVDNLPINLSHLTFGASFNKSVDDLPENLTHLTFGHDFDNLVDKLPKDIEIIDFTNCYYKDKYKDYDFSKYPKVKIII